MIKLFRNIRKNLLNEGKTAKYFKYAIGEIVLVVIGILIALSINNWNTNKANEKQAYNQLLEVQKEILNNIIEFDKKGDSYFEQLRNVRRVFSDTLTIEDYRNNRRLGNIMTSYLDINLQNDAYLKLVQNADNLPNQYKPLVPKLKALYNHTPFETSFADLLSLQNQFFHFTIDYSEARYRGNNEPLYQFLLTNKDYKNRLARFSYTLDDLAVQLVEKKYDGIALYNEMIKLGFPDDNLYKLATIYLDTTPEMAAPFIGRYTNTVDTLSIYLSNKELTADFTAFNNSRKLIIRDKSTLNMNGGDLEFNDDKSEFYMLMEAQQPHFKRIPAND